jgi:hypothetical protein
VLIVHIILAAAAVAAIAVRPEAGIAVAVVAAAAAVDVALGTDAGPAHATVLPLAGFLTAALSLAALVERSGLCDRAAAALARRAGGRGPMLYVLVCALCAALTAVVSLDGAVVLMVPLALALHRRFGAPFAPLFVGIVAVANAVSIAVPQGNPTNLVVMERLGLSPTAFAGHMLVPGVAAAVACALGVGLSERAALGRAYARERVGGVAPRRGARRLRRVGRPRSRGAGHAAGLGGHARGRRPGRRRPRARLAAAPGAAGRRGRPRGLRATRDAALRPAGPRPPRRLPSVACPLSPRSSR